MDLLAVVVPPVTDQNRLHISDSARSGSTSLALQGSKKGNAEHLWSPSLLIHMDGQATTAQKNATWRAVVNARPEGMSLGWKNFYDEDHPMLTPEQTMAHEPEPMVITCQ